MDGKRTEIHPANAAFRAIRLPAGRHRVRFEYRPASVRVGTVVSAMAWVAIVVGLLGASLYGRRSAATRRAARR